ncbi:MAG: hypothetical protein LP071_02330 [Candidatus Nanogingivalaceae bacterium]|nr:hypothetical protein [Candidatus Nanogingivalaceae bacterium]
MYKNSGQSGLDIKRKRTTVVYALVWLSLFIGVAVVTKQCFELQSKAMTPGRNKQVEINQANYRLYDTSTTTAPAAALAADNTPATLAKTKNSFRVRVGIENNSSAFTSVSTGGFNHTCSIDSHGKPYCWGEGTYGALGRGSTASSSVPVAVDMSGVLSGKTIKQIAVGDWHTCAVASDGKAYCWGYGVTHAELGNGTMSQANSPVAVATNGVLSGKTVKRIAAGFDHNCAIASDDNVYCWGEGEHGALGNGSTARAATPVAVSTTGALAGKTIKRIAAGIWHTCAIASDDKVYCWGDNGNGQLGNGSTTQSNVPVAVSTTGALAGKTIKRIATGSDHACAVTTDNQVYCWGRNSNGELGNGSTADSNVPVAVSMPGTLAGKTIKRLSGGSYRTCAIAYDNQVYCWGNNDHGQFGNNSTTSSRTPVATSSNGDSISSGQMKVRAQYAEKTAATCNAVTSGWQDITSNSALAYSPTGPSNGAAINAHTSDPVLPPDSMGYSYQSIVRGTSGSPLVFTNNREINAGETGLWDLALTDLTLKRNTSYCIRLVTDTVTAPGTSIDTYLQYPEFKTADGSLDLRFTNAANATLNNPTTKFSNATTTRDVSTTTASLSNDSSQQLEVSNSLSTTGWNVSLAATGGASAKWMRTGGAGDYGFNSTDASRGRLTVDLSSSIFVANGSTPAGQTCSTTGLSYGAGGDFIAGTPSANSITLANASSSSGLNCMFKLQNIGLKQTVPAYQKSGVYTLPVTVTVTAQ